MGQTIKRKDDWAERLEAFINEHQETEFKYGEFDCAMYVCDAIKAMTDVDVGETFRDLYHSKTGAAKIMREYDGLEAIGDTIAKGYGMHAVGSNFAGRGDPVVFYFAGVESFGFISLSGRDICGLSEHGNTVIPKSKATIIRAWSFE